MITARNISGAWERRPGKLHGLDAHDLSLPRLFELQAARPWDRELLRGGDLSRMYAELLRGDKPLEHIWMLGEHNTPPPGCPSGKFRPAAIRWCRRSSAQVMSRAPSLPLAPRGHNGLSIAERRTMGSAPGARNGD